MMDILFGIYFEAFYWEISLLSLGLNSPDLRAWDPKEYFVRFRQIDGVSK